MNVKQLLLGLSILVPVGAYGAAHSPSQETVRVVAELCNIRDSVIKNKIYYEKIMLEPPICYDLMYGARLGLVFVQIDTLQGTFFGFYKQALYESQNPSEDAYKDLIESLRNQYQGALSIGCHGTFNKKPLKLNHH